MARDFGFIELDGLVNLRDVGGKPTADGGVIRKGVLLRSDNLQDLPPASVRWFVDEVGLSDVVDLRTNLERVGCGDGPMKAEALTFHELSMYPEDEWGTGIPDDDDTSDEVDLPWQSEQNLAERAEMDHHEHLARHYLGYLERRPDNVVKALRAIAHAPGAVLVHCAAGKDRTGTVTALALTIAGVDRQEVVADYDASNQRVEKIFNRLVHHPVYEADMAGQTVADQTTPSETMELLLAAVDAEYGSLDAWLAANGWTADDTRALLAKLVEPAS